MDDARDPEAGAPVEGIMISYRFTDEPAEEIRRTATEKAEGAEWN